MRALLFMVLVLIVFGLIMLVAGRVRRWQARMDQSDSDQDHTSTPTVRCVRCGAFVPAQRAIETDRGPVCPEHQS